MFSRKLFFAIPITLLLSTLPLLAQTPTPQLGTSGVDYPGPNYHYTVKTAWTDTRVITWMNGSTKNAIGFVFNETPGAWYFPYDYNSPQQVTQANAVYATLLTAMSTSAEINIHLFANYNGHYYFDEAQIGPAY